MSTELEFALFGTCVLRRTAPPHASIMGVKHRALFALLLTAPLARRSRTYLQTTLWGRSDYDSGHQNLRRALSDLRKELGEIFEDILIISSTEIELDLSRIKVIGSPADGLFLEDLNIGERAFVAWRDEIRADPSPVEALCALARARGPARLQPRVCALPLATGPHQPELTATADWIAEEACRVISRSALVAVISHLSGRAMSARVIDIAHVRSTLDVDYLLTGSLREHRGEWIADIDFIDTATGQILWNRNLACPREQFADRITEWLANIVRNVGRTIAENALLMGRQTALPELPSHELLIAGATAMHHPTLRDFLRAKQLLTEATDRMPDNPLVHAWLGKWYVLNIFKNYSIDRQADTQAALDCTARALDLDPEISFGLTIDGFVHSNILGDLETADRRYSAAQDINPNESLAWLLRGSLMAFRDDGKSAVRAAHTARRLSPIDPFGYYFDSLSSSAHLAAGEFAQALEFADRSLARNSRHISTLRTRIAALHALDRGDEARETASDLLRRFPEFSLSDYRKTHPSSEHRTGQLVVTALAAAGIQ